MMSLAKLSYQNELWTTYQLSDIRNIAAGLSLSDLKNNLTLELILSIEASAFEFMNKQVIEELIKSNQTLDYLSKDHLSFLMSNKNYQELSESLKTNLNSNYNGNLANKYDIIDPNSITTSTTSSLNVNTIRNQNKLNKSSSIKFSISLLIISLSLIFFNLKA